jgi:hypothetical protein
MTIWCMQFTCWIPKATNTHSEYLILIHTATMVAQTRLNVTLYLHCLSGDCWSCICAWIKRVLVFARDGWFVLLDGFNDAWRLKVGAHLRKGDASWLLSAANLTPRIRNKDTSFVDTIVSNGLKYEYKWSITVTTLKYLAIQCYMFRLNKPSSDITLPYCGCIWVSLNFLK